MLRQRALLEGKAAMRGAFSLFSHPYKGMRENAKGQAVGKEPPSWGSGGPSTTAVGLTDGKPMKGATWNAERT